MKRIKFLSGISAMCAFAVIALAGSLMTSCDEEDFQGTFKTKPAEAIINVTVTDLSTGSAVSGAAISASAGTVSGTTVTLTSTAADGSLAAQAVTISATASGYTIQSTTVNVLAMSAGGYAIYAANLFAVPEGGDEPGPGPEEPAAVDWGQDTADETPIVYELLDPTHSHADNGKYWGTNANDYSVTESVACTIYKEWELVSNDITDEAAAKEAEEMINALLSNNDTKQATWTFEVPSWSNYRAWQTVYPTLTTYTASREGKGLGSFVIRAKASNVLEYEWIGIAGHDHTHGHGHGADNAGGGIIYAD